MKQYALEYVRPQYNFEEHYEKSKSKETLRKRKSLLDDNLQVVKPSFLTAEEKKELAKKKPEPKLQADPLQIEKISHYQRSASSAVLKSDPKELQRLVLKEQQREKDSKRYGHIIPENQKLSKEDQASKAKPPKATKPEKLPIPAKTFYASFKD